MKRKLAPCKSQLGLLLGKRARFADSVSLGIARSKVQNRTERNSTKKCVLKSSKCFLRPWIVWIQFPKVFLSLNDSEKNSECFSHLRNCSEQNSKHFYSPRNLVWNKIMRFGVFFSPTKWFGTEFRAFFYLPRKGSERNSECFLFRLTDNFRLFHVPE
jgi:hypothetical protein